VTDDTAIGMVSSTDDGAVHTRGAPARTDADAAGDSLGGLPRSSRTSPEHLSDDAMVPHPGHASVLDPLTSLVGLDSHDHPWDEQPPPVVDLGQVID
jgi:hypothetical protein